MAAPTAVGAKRGWFTSRWDRLNGSARIAGVDLARGLAVLGMLGAHLLWIDPFAPLEPSTWIAVVDGRSSILFATLAGVSIGLVTGGTAPFRGPRLRVARLRLIVRGLLLWMIGVALVLTGVPVYVILPAYAVLFLLALPFLSLGARALLPLAGALAVIMPFVQVPLDGLPFWDTDAGFAVASAIGWHYPFLVWIAFVLAGLGVARAGILRREVQWRMLAVGAGLAVLGYGLHGVSGVDPASESASYWDALWTARPHSSGLLEVIGSGGFAIAVLAVCLLLCRPSTAAGLRPTAYSTPIAYVTLPLRAVGAMPLSAYVGQLVVWVIIASALLDSPGDLVGFRELDPFWPLTLGIVAGCTAWALLIGRGPLEWAVDRIARLAVPGSRLPKVVAASSAQGGSTDDR